MPVPQAPINILSKPAQKWRGSEKIWLPAWRDRNGTLLRNSANRMHVKPHYEQYTIGIYHFKKFKIYTDAMFANELDTINSQPWGGFSAGQAWISEIHTEGLDTIENVTGEVVHYVIRCIKRTDGWKFQVPDVGYIYKAGSELKSFVTDDGFPYMGNLTAAGGDGGDTMLIKLNNTKFELNFSSISGLE